MIFLHLQLKAEKMWEDLAVEDREDDLVLLVIQQECL